MSHSAKCISHTVTATAIHVVMVVFLLLLSTITHAASKDSTQVDPPPSLQIKGQYLNMNFTSIPGEANYNTSTTSYFGTPDKDLQCPDNYQLAGIEERQSPPTVPANRTRSPVTDSWSWDRKLQTSAHFRFTPYCDYADSSYSYRCTQYKWIKQYYRQDGLRIHCITGSLNWENVSTTGEGAHTNSPGTDYNL